MSTKLPSSIVQSGFTPVPYPNDSDLKSLVDRYAYDTVLPVSSQIPN